VVIFGKKGHAEVLGLVGQAKRDAIVIESIDEIEKLDFTKPIELFAQTTKSADEYKEIADEILRRMNLVNNGESVDFKVYNSICGQVANRKTELKSFAKKVDAIVFVSGKKSSNGKMLYEVCRSVNPKSYFISSPSELAAEWFKDINSVGICGATSTPLWLMEQVADSIRILNK